MATYMDDRNILVKSAQTASEVVVFWREAASVLGLKENEEKLKVVPRSVTQRRDLEDVGLQACIFDTARVLGVDFTSKLNAGLPQRPTAVCRLKEAVSRARRVACLPVWFEQRHTLLRQMVFPLAAWGHFLKQLPVGATTALRAMSRKALYNTAAQGHTGLRDVLEGHYVNVVALSQMQAILALGWTVRKGETSTYAVRVGSWLETAATSLRHWGWTQSEPWVWRHDHLGVINWRTATDSDLESIKHRLRESWRRARFASFASSSRRELRDLPDISYDEERCKIARKLYVSGTSHMRAVLAAAVESGACLSKMKGESVPQLCRHCKAHVIPDWMLCAWSCDAFSNGRPPQPSDPFEARLGWPQPGGSSEVLLHLAHVRQCLLEARYRPEVHLD